MTTATTSGTPGGALRIQKAGGSGEHHDEEWRRRERERLERERRARAEDWRRRHPPVSGQAGPTKTATTTPAPAAASGTAAH